jgi:hypothetical protein
MPLDKSGKYHMNQQIANAHDAAAPMGIPERGTAPKDYQKIEIEKKPEGGYTTTSHPTDGGAPEVEDHATVHDAHAVMNDKFGEDGCSADSSEEDYEGEPPDPTGHAMKF